SAMIGAPPALAQAPGSMPDSAAALSPFNSLAGTAWVAEGSGFRSLLSYHWLLPGMVLAASNEVSRPDGSVMVSYRGSYAWDAGRNELVFWNASSSGEVHRGRAWWESGLLWHEAAISGGRLASYASAVRHTDSTLHIYSSLGAKAASPDVLQETPLKYTPVREASGMVPDATGPLDVVSFMTGCWRGEFGDDGVLEESYSLANGGVMLGTSRYFRAGRVVQHEFSSIIADTSGVSLLPYPGGRVSEHAFRLTHAAADTAVFEAPEHDFPRRISYIRVADRGLLARVDGGEGSTRVMYWLLEPVQCTEAR